MSRRRTRVPRGFRRFRPTPSAPQLRPRGAPGTAVLRGGPSQQLHTLRPSRGTWLTCSSLLPVSPSAFALYLLPVRGRNLQPRALLTALSLAPPLLTCGLPSCALSGWRPRCLTGSVWFMPAGVFVHGCPSLPAFPCLVLRTQICAHAPYALSLPSHTCLLELSRSTPLRVRFLPMNVRASHPATRARLFTGGDRPLPADAADFRLAPARGNEAKWFQRTAWGSGVRTQGLSA